MTLGNLPAVRTLNCEPSYGVQGTCVSTFADEQLTIYELGFLREMYRFTQPKGLALFVVICFYVVLHARADGHSTCPLPESVVEFKGNPKDAIFHQISGSEMASIVEYLKAEGVVDLNRNELESPFDVLNTNYIMNFGLALPPKAEVLAYLDADGPEPGRYAIVTVNRGAGVPRDVMVSDKPTVTL